MGRALVIGREEGVAEKLKAEGMSDAVGELEIVNAAKTPHLETYKDFLYERLQRKGMDRQDVHRLAARDRHVFASLMVSHGHADGMVTGATRKSAHVLELINHVFDAQPHHGAVGVSAILHKGRIVLMADTLVHEWPDENDLADIAERGAAIARELGLEPRVAFVSFSTFGYPISERAEKMHVAPTILDQRKVDFEYEGEMNVDVALNPAVMEQYPFQRLSGPANVLVVPARHSASISVKLMQEMAGATVIGPILSGVGKPVQLCSTTSTVNDILNMAVIAACRIG
jgi:malate dehydrogenase (oxaloacetate-decarboxylating)(NADP+)